MKNNHEISYIKEMCESLSHNFDEKKFQNEVKAFSNFLCSVTNGYKYNRSYLEEQSIHYINFRNNVINHITNFNNFKNELHQKRSELDKITKDNGTEILFILNGIFKVNLSEQLEKINSNEVWNISNFYEGVKTIFFYNNLTTTSIIIMVCYGNKKIVRYYFYETVDMNIIVQELCKKLVMLWGNI